MKKTLLAAALLTGYAGAAMAQNSVTLYGVVDLGFQYTSVKNGTNTTFGPYAANDTSNQFAMTSGQRTASRWGVRGVEDLGNGLKATFQYEALVTATTGSSTAGFTRVSTLGLSSDAWGSVLMGRDVTAGTRAFSGIDPFGASYGTSQLNEVLGNSFMRESSQIQYISPSISGFNAYVGYSFNSGATVVAPNADSTGLEQINSQSFGTNNKNRALSLGVRYANGPILLAAAYDQTFVSGVASNPVSSDPKSWLVGGTYDLKVVKLHAAYGQSIDGFIGGTTALTELALAAGDGATQGRTIALPGARTQGYMIGVSAPIGGGSLFANWKQQMPGGEFKSDGTATQSSVSLGYTYSLSSRTIVYGFYSYTNNNAMIKDTSSNQAGLGITHSF